MIKTKVLTKISQQHLDKKLKLNLENKYIEGEQWFKNPELWYELTAFSNPYITVYSELVLLIQNLNKISGFLSDRALVFYGLGTGDTEIILVNSLLLKEKSINVVGVEIQARFIEGFIQSLQNIALENDEYKINFLGIHGLFQETAREDLKISDKKQAHIILGNTIGNFREDDIFQIFFFSILKNFMNANKIYFIIIIFKSDILKGLNKSLDKSCLYFYANNIY